MNELYGIIAVLAAIIVGIFSARQSGKKAERNEQLKRDVKARDKADEISEKVRRMDDDDILREFDKLHDDRRR